MASPDLTLEALLSDPLVLTLMKADRVDPARLRAKLTRIGEDVARRRSERGEERSAGGCVQARFAQARLAPARAGGCTPAGGSPSW